MASDIKCESWVLGMVASCEDCDWTCDDYKNDHARKNAYKHTYCLGHKVNCEVVRNFQYSIKEKTT